VGDSTEEVEALRERIAALEQSEARYRALFEHANDAIFVSDLERGKYVEVNDRALALLGYSREELLAMGPADIASERQAPEPSTIIAEIREKGHASFQYRVRHKGGSELLLHARTTLHDRDGQRFLQTIARDIRDFQADDLLAALLENSADYIFFKDKGRRFVRASSSFEALLGVAKTEIIGKRDEDLFPPEISEQTIADDRRVIEEGVPVVNRVEGGRVSEGVERWVSTTKIPWRGRDGTRLGLYGISKDITELELARQELDASEKRLRQIIDALFGFVGLYTVEGVLVEANRAPLQAAGLDPDEVLGKLFWETYWWNYDPAVQERLRKVMARAAAGEVVRYEERVRIIDDALIDLDLSFGPMYAPDGSISGIIGFGVDITARTRAQSTLRDKEERLRFALEASGQGTWELDLVSWTATYDAQHAAMLGYRHEELTGQNRDEFVESLHPDDREATFAAFEAYLDGTVPKYEAQFRLRTKSGEWRWILATGKTKTHKIDPDARRMIGTHTDITARVEADQRRAAIEQHLRHAQRLESLGTLAGGIAHDFNNLLTIIKSNLFLATRALGRDDPVQEHLEAMRIASERAATSVEQILVFSRRQVPKRSAVVLDDLIEDAARMLRTTLPTGISLRVSLDSTRPSALVDPTQLHQVMLNLCTNAWQAMDANRGTVDLSLDCVSVTGGTSAPVDLPPGQYARISVTDDGKGMDSGALEQVFDPFFTTKPPGEGTGLGLSIVHGIVKDHEGVITVESEPNEGTTFRVYLPQISRSTSARERIQPSIPPRKGRVLFLDDEAAVVSSTTVILRSLGYEASGTTSPAEALGLIRADPLHFDVVVTDYQMPEASGIDVAAAIRDIHPDLPVLLISGYHRSTQAEIEASDIRQVIQKPFTPEGLDEVLQQFVGSTERASSSAQASVAARSHAANIKSQA
jgi:PAS domain S-box-containing protein